MHNPLMAYFYSLSLHLCTPPAAPQATSTRSLPRLKTSFSEEREKNMASSSDRTPQSELHPFSSQHVSRRDLLAGALYLLPVSGFMQMEQEEGSTGMEAITNFEPRQHGFHFRNDFVNVIFDRAGLHLVTYGRCGG